MCVSAAGVGGERSPQSVSTGSKMAWLKKKILARMGGDQNCRGEFILFWHLAQTSALRESDWQHESLACWASLADGEDLVGWK